MKYVLWSALVVSLGFGGWAFGKGEDEKEVTTSREAFRQLMQNPVIQDSFTYVQQELIPTRFDSKLRNFFREHPVLRQLYQAYVENEEAALNEFVKHAQSTMMRIRKDMGSSQARQLFKMVVELAKELGFSDEAISNIQIFVTDGSKNAFTVSASKDRIIIVFQSELLDTMTMDELRTAVREEMRGRLGSELKAIVGHELGHIVLGHSTIRRMSGFMVNLLGSIFIQTPEDERFVSQAMSAANASQGFCSGGCSMAQNFGPLMNFNGGEAHLQAIERDAMAKFSMNPQLRDQILVQFLSVALMGMDEYLAPRQALTVMNHYRQVIINELESQDEGRFYPSSAAREFMFAVSSMMNSFSRSQEVSSDRISDSVVKREFLASAFIRMLGLDRSDVKDRKKLIQQTVEQGTDLLQSSNRSELARLIGTTHPSSVLRIYIMMQMPSYPAIIIANPFTKLLALHQYLMMEKGLTAAYLAGKPFAGEDGKAEKEFFEKHLQAMQQASEESFATILHLLKHRGLGEQRHPRFVDLTQYSLVQREQQLAQIHELKEAIGQNAGNQQLAAMLQERLQILENVFLPQAAEFLSRIAKEMSAGVPADSPIVAARVQALQVASNAMDLAQVRNFRRQHLEVDPSRRWRNEPVADLKAPNFVSSLQIESMDAKAETPKRPATPSLIRGLRCEGIVRGG